MRTQRFSACEHGLLCLLYVSQDERDLPMLYLLYNITTTVPLGAFVVFVLPPSHVVGLLYFATTYVLFLQRFILALHFSEHRKIFHKEKGSVPKDPTLLLFSLRAHLCFHSQLREICCGPQSPSLQSLVPGSTVVDMCVC